MADASISDYGERVRVILTVAGATDLKFPIREFSLSRARPTMVIGRSSSNPVKALIAAENNAYFDSPVMSRNHAELNADLNSKTVYVRDVGSTHGTFVNTNQLTPNVPHPLANDDNLTFGVAIERRDVTFPPTKMGVKVEFYDCLPGDLPLPHIYRVPSSCGDEEDADCISDVNDADFYAKSASPIGLATGQDPQTSVIDLTSPLRDESPEVAALHNETDAASEVSQHCQNTAAIIVPRDNQSGDLNEPVVALDDGKSIDLNNDEDDEEMRQDSDSEIEDYVSEVGYSDSGQADTESHESDEEGYSSSDDDPLSEDEQILAPVDDDMDNDPYRDDEESEVDASQIIPSPQLAVSHAGQPLNMAQVPLPHPVWNCGPPQPNLLPPVLSTASSYFVPVKMPQTPSLPEKFKETAEALGAKPGKQEYFAAREQNKIILSQRPSISCSSEWSPQPQLYSETENPPLCTTTPFSDLTKYPQDKRPSTVAPLLDQFEASTSNVQLANLDSPWQRTAKEFLYSTPQDPPRLLSQQKAGTPDDDAMASAYALQQWKQHEASSHEAEILEHPRKIAISDIVRTPLEGVPDSTMELTEKETPEKIIKEIQTEARAKRKAANISTVSDQDLEWAGLGQAAEVEIEIEADLAECNAAPEVTSSSTLISPPPSPFPPLPSTSLSQEPEDSRRPSKRLRRIAERVGYAALGGATVGAMVLTSLIYTAPSFA